MSRSVIKLHEITGDDSSTVGGKAVNLAKMLQADLPVPNGMAVSLNGFDNEGQLTSDAKRQIETELDKNKLYAVRSSALAEDAQGASWAGQFETFLNVNPENMCSKVIECHNSAKNRAHAYAEDKTATNDFDIAVVVQEMLKPEYAGVLFTKDPLSGTDHLVTEYIEGLGEELVSGRADPKRIIIDPDQALEAPFDTTELAALAIKTEKLFGVPQDIEWVWANDKFWLVQARPITVMQESRDGYYLGEPNELFYWGPSRTQPMYMSDWLAATDQVFAEMAEDKELPSPPKTLVIFCDSKMVYLCHGEAFGLWCEQSFIAYKKRNTLADDIQKWQQLVDTLGNLDGETFSKNLVEAWHCTILPEFSLYGAESSLAKQLQRFDAQTRQDIWGAFTVPDKPTFLSRIDSELAASQDPEALAEKYPWIQDGYDGTSLDAASYFQKRFKIVGDDTHASPDKDARRAELINKLQLNEEEVSALKLARQLAEFMDDRKAWMMQSRRLIKKSVGDIEHGWFFNDGIASKLNKDDAQALWQRYVDFKTSTSAVAGIVASNGGRHFVNGEVVIVDSPTDNVEDDKIVVVPSTSPSYVPLMRKARALVTDHGGMMSHAAIVAREFNLPCVVGTKQATKVLKTGDKVVIDLVKGEVNR